MRMHGATRPVVHHADHVHVDNRFAASCDQGVITLSLAVRLRDVSPAIRSDRNAFAADIPDIVS